MAAYGHWELTIDVEIPVMGGVPQNLVLNEVIAAMQAKGNVNRASIWHRPPPGAGPEL